MFQGVMYKENRYSLTLDLKQVKKEVIFLFILFFVLIRIHQSPLRQVKGHCLQEPFCWLETCFMQSV